MQPAAPQNKRKREAEATTQAKRANTGQGLPAVAAPIVAPTPAVAAPVAVPASTVAAPVVTAPTVALGAPAVAAPVAAPTPDEGLRLMRAARQQMGRRWNETPAEGRTRVLAFVRNTLVTSRLTEEERITYIIDRLKDTIPLSLEAQAAQEAAVAQAATARAQAAAHEQAARDAAALEAAHQERAHRRVWSGVRSRDIALAGSVYRHLHEQATYNLTGLERNARASDVQWALLDRLQNTPDDIRYNGLDRNSRHSFRIGDTRANFVFSVTPSATPRQGPSINFYHLGPGSGTA